MTLDWERLDPNTRDLLTASMDWMDTRWDEAAGLLVYPPPAAEHVEHPLATGVRHAVRDTVWYALGLLGRAGRGDGDRACRALSAILDCQWDAPGAPYHGTFRRATEEPDPPANPVRWRDYDPNWRQFIGTILAMIIDDCGYDLPADLVARMDRAIRLATIGEEQEGRLSERYTNIALMRAPLDCWAGARYGRPQWLARGQEWARTIHRNFMEFGAFDEYNSPTYYGTDIYALGLWQAYSSSLQLQLMGAEMEEMLWGDIAQFYHAGLKNIAGPYDRSYGMDMRRYVALLGEYIWLVTGREGAPFPDLDAPLEHAGDFCFGPMVAVRLPRIPADVLVHFHTFGGERFVEHLLADAPPRKATAWLAERVMIGAEATSLRDIGQGQFHPATIHWSVPRAVQGDREGCPYAQDGGWVRLMVVRPVDALASPHRLTVTSLGPVSFLIACPAVPGGERSQTTSVAPDHWRLPGLEVRVEASAIGVVEYPGKDQILVRYGHDGEAGENEQGKRKKEERKTRIVLDLHGG